MVGFVLRRIAVSILVLLAASFIMYVLSANSGNPLEDLQGSNDPNRDQLIAARIAALDLDVPPVLRYFLWLGGAAQCLIPFVGSCDLGTTISNAPVTSILPAAMVSTLQLVTVAFVVAIVLGVAVGIVTALRQYSGFDFGVTLVSFFLYSLPSFLIAVLLKEFMAIGFNDFLVSATSIPPLVIVLITVISAVVWQAMIGGNVRRRLIVAGISGAATAALLVYFDLADWFRNPGFGPVGLFILIAGTVVLTTALIAGLENRRALIVAGINGAIAYISYFALQGLFDISSLGTLIILGIAALAVGIITGLVLGGNDRGQAARIGAIVAFVTSSLVVLDRFMQSWPAYVNSPRIGGRPIATVGASTPGFTGDVWLSGIDSFTHLLLPTIALLLISFAGYTRYARSGLLEVMNQDYIRTARAKGLGERTVVMRHALRNMLIPIVTLIATDIGALLGGAVITERVFAISGMGQLFVSSILRTDVNPVMGYFLIIAVTAILFNFLADLAYAALDPRVRVAA
ncbi:peptide/nickel transport system permease protein [Microbacterium sp. AG1240]|uniref:ABC transporter permease n=1 Tax=Microbacterium sp. AG1240 TaxID=2183992 RepID=UPI000EAF7E3F|nr:ABC transporter permease [Microbacterium sp. AG1240]RKT36542.1 peptide/nickel transport system permease protein [Microbacterium sp. AG1240]